MKINLALEQLRKLISKKGDHGLLIARKHMNWTCKGFTGSTQLRQTLVRAKTSKEAIDILENALKKFN